MVSPTAVEKPSSKATRIEAICSRISNFRRSTASPTAPAGSANRNTGRLDTACTNVTMTGVGRSFVISQAVPTLPSQMPTFETRLASHTARKVGIASGVQADGLAARFVAAAFPLTRLHSAPEHRYANPLALLHIRVERVAPPAPGPARCAPGKDRSRGGLPGSPRSPARCRRRSAPGYMIPPDRRYSRRETARRPIQS